MPIRTHRSRSTTPTADVAAAAPPLRNLAELALVALILALFLAILRALLAPRAVALLSIALTIR